MTAVSKPRSSCGRAEHVAPVAARHEVAGAGLAPAHDAVQQAGAAGVAQAQRLALDRAHARLVAERARPRPGREHDLLGRQRADVRRPRRRCAARRRRARAARASAAQTRRGIGAVVVGQVQRAAHGGRERRLEPTRRAGQQRLDVQPEALAQVALALERLGLVAIAGEHQRAARAVADVDAAASASCAANARPAPRAAQPELEQRPLAGVGLGHRREHPGGDARRPGAELAALEQEHRQAALAGAPRDREADDAAADDRYVVAVAVAVAGGMSRPLASPA